MHYYNAPLLKNILLSHTIERQLILTKCLWTKNETGVNASGAICSAKEAPHLCTEK